MMSVPGEPRGRRTVSNVYRGMTVNKALAILKISQSEYNKMDDDAFKKAFSKIGDDDDDDDDDEEVPEDTIRIRWGIPQQQQQNLKKKKKLLPAVDPWNPKVHEALQYLLKKRAANNERLLAKFGRPVVGQEDKLEGQDTSDTDCGEPQGEWQEDDDEEDEEEEKDEIDNETVKQF